MRKTVAVAILAIVATAPRAHGQERTSTTTATRGDYLRLPDFTCYIDAWYQANPQWGWQALPVSAKTGWTYVANGSTLQAVESRFPLVHFNFYVRNVGPVAGTLPEWSYTVTQKGVSVASFVNSGQKPQITITPATLAKVDYMDPATVTKMWPDFERGLNKMTANFTARTPSAEISKSNNGCTFSFLIDYQPK